MDAAYASILVDIYVRVCSLPDVAFPAHMTRHNGMLLLAFAPGVLGAELVAWAFDRAADVGDATHLSHLEIDALLVAYGGHPRGQRQPEAMLTARTMNPVPKVLRLPASQTWTDKRAVMDRVRDLTDAKRQQEIARLRQDFQAS